MGGKRRAKFIQKERSKVIKNNGRRKPTLKDVARRAGVSTATVERALNNSGRIRAETKARVLQAIEELRYSTNEVARALQNGRSYTILAVYHTDPEYFTADFARGFAAVEANLSSRGLILKTLRTKSLQPQDAIEALKQIDFSTIDAMVIDCGGTELDAYIGDIIRNGVPVATFGSDSPSSGRNFYVGENPYVSGQMAGEMAAKMSGGQGNFVVFQGSTKVYAFNQRTRGFADVLKNEYPRMKLLPGIEHNDDDTAAIRGAIRMFTDGKRPAGVFCNTATGTVAMYRAMQYLDLPAAETPIIIGYDLNQEIYQMLQQDRCHVTIYQNPFMQAYDVVNYMFEYITHSVIPPKARNYVPVHVVFKHNAEMYLADMSH